MADLCKEALAANDANPKGWQRLGQARGASHPTPSLGHRTIVQRLLTFSARSASLVPSALVVPVFHHRVCRQSHPALPGVFIRVRPSLRPQACLLLGQEEAAVRHLQRASDLSPKSAEIASLLKRAQAEAAAKKRRERAQFGGLFSSDKYKAHALGEEQRRVAAEARRRERIAASISRAAAATATDTSGAAATTSATTDQPAESTDGPLLSAWAAEGTSALSKEDLTRLEVRAD